MALKPEQLGPAVALMKNLALFAGCSEAQLQAVAAHLDSTAVPVNRVIIMEQEISKTLYLLVQGSVGIFRRIKGEKQLVATLNAPDFFGEASMFSEFPANALVKAQELCQLFTLPRPAFDQLAGADPSFALLVERNLQTIDEKRPPLVRKETGTEGSAA